MLTTKTQLYFSIKRVFCIIGIFSIIPSCNTSSDTKQVHASAYARKLESMKVYYPFETWKTYINNLPQYTPDNCNSAKEIFDTLISDLISNGENASEEIKIKCFEKAILALNELNVDCEGALIETGEREGLCDLTDKITAACGLDPKKYNDGAGLADTWRDW